MLKDIIEEYKPYIDLTDEGEYQIRIKCVSKEDAYEKLKALRETAQIVAREVLRKALPHLRQYKNTLDCDWSLNPVQAVNAVYRSPESVLRDQADEIERKREESIKLNQLIADLQSLEEELLTEVLSK